MEWNIGCIATKRARLTPNKPALIYEDMPITYRKLNEETNRAAHYLQKLGLKKGDRICVFLLNCPEFLYLYFAAAKLGLIFVPLNFRMVGPELEYQLNNSGARMLAFHDALMRHVEPIRGRVAVEKDKFLYVKSITPDCPACPEWAVSYDEEMKNYPVDEPEPEEPVAMDDPLAIVYTSGVTGDPKGALVSHSQTYFKNFQIMFYCDMREDDVYLAQLPLFHSGGLFVSFTPGLCRGATMLMRQGFDPAQFALDIEKYKATVVLALTTMWRFVLETGKLDEIDTSSLRAVLGGGERTPQILFDELEKKGIRMQQAFGQTENSAMMCLPKKDIKRKQGSIGIPGFFTEIWIEDEKGRKLPPREIGEIVARGPNVMMGYWNMPEKTAEAIVDGILHTGDLGYTDEEGYFYIVDRSKDMYRSGGENVYPAETEKVLSEHPKILNIAIIGVPDERWGETGKALIVPKEGQTITPEEITAFLKDKVAKFKYPTRFEFLESLPMTASGKIAKAELKKKYGGVRLDK